MDKLGAEIFALIQDQHPAKIRSLSNRIRSTPIENCASLSGHFSTDIANQLLDDVLKQWQRVGCSSDELAGLVAGASIGYIEQKERERVQLVWSGPDLKQFPVRRSEQVLLELINGAEESLFIVSFVLVNVPSIEDAIAKAVERGVDVRMLIESEDKKEDSDNFRETVVRLYDSISGIMLYVWPRANRENTQGGFARVHAKCAVVDDNKAFVTSANLTSAALDKNIEVGIQLTGGNIPLGISKQLKAMITSKEIIPYAINNLNQESKDKQPKPISLDELPDVLEQSESAIVQFQNENLNIAEARVFGRYSSSQDKPKMNSVVVIEHDGEIMMGKITWTLQQETKNAEEKFYYVSIRGFKPTQRFRLSEHQWSEFYPLAIEITK